MHCQEVRSTLYSYLDHELDNQQERRLYWHLSGCPKCQQEMEAAREFDQLVQESCTHVDPPKELNSMVMASIKGESFTSGKLQETTAAVKPLRSRSWRYSVSALVGAAAMVFFVITGINFLSLENNPDTKQIVQEEAETPIINNPGVTDTSEISESGVSEASDRSVVDETPEVQHEETAPVEENSPLEETSTGDIPQSGEEQEAAETSELQTSNQGQESGNLPQESTENPAQQSGDAETEVGTVQPENTEDWEYEEILPAPKPEISDPEGMATIAGTPVSGSIRRISNPETSGMAPAWDEDEVRYVAYEDDRYVIWSGKIEQEKNRGISLPDKNAKNFNWNASGSQIAYQLQKDGKSYVKVMAGLGQLLQAEGFNPKWSEGNELAFLRDTSDGTEVVVYAENKGEKVLAISQNKILEMAWAPGGEKLAYVSDTPEGFRVMLAAEGQEPASIMDFSKDGNISIDWSPDGKKLALNHFSKEQDGGVWLLAADGSSLKKISSSGNGVAVKWSPDGEKIVYSNDEGKLELLYLAPGEKVSKVRELTTEGDIRQRINIRWDAASGMLIFDLQKQGEHVGVWQIDLPQDNQS